MAGTEDVGLEAVADHQRLVAAGVGIDQGKVEDALVRFLDTSVFRQDHPLEIRRQAGVAQFLVLHFAEAVRQDIQAVGRAKIFQQFDRAGNQPCLGGRASEEIIVDGQYRLGIFDAHRAQHITEAVDDKRLPVDLSRTVLLPKQLVVRPIDSKESLEGGIIPVKVVIGIKLFEAFFIIMVRIPKGIVQIYKEVFVFHHPTSITRYLPRLQNVFGSVMFSVRLPSSSFTNS